MKKFQLPVLSETEKTAQELFLESKDLLFRTLEGYGNILSSIHKKALERILEGFVGMSYGNETGRLAYPLDAGCGKTSAIIAFLATAFRKGLLGTPISVAVSASRIEALADLKRALVQDHGVPEDLIGFLHSYQYNESIAKAYIKEDKPLPFEYASEPSTNNSDNNNRPILLLTHNKITQNKKWDKYSQFKGGKRSLLIWDESLIKAESRALRLDLIKTGCGIRKDYEKSDIGKAAIGYVENAIMEFETRAEPDFKGPTDFRLPSLTPEKIRAYRKVFFGTQFEPCVRELLDVSQSDFRVVMGNGKNSTAAIQYTIVVPAKLQPVAVLDASYGIRELCAIDKTINIPDWYPKGVVDYKDVIVNQIRHKSGRRGLEKDINQKNFGLVEEFVDIVKKIPKDEALLTFTFKPRAGKDPVTGLDPVDFRAVLEKAWESAGIDTKAEVMVNGKAQPRFCWLTHGNETSLSRYSYCQNVLWYGVLHRDPSEIASKIAGQADDIKTDLSQIRVRKTETSEVVYCLHQGTARGCCRVIQNGKASPMKVWLTYPNDTIRKGLNDAMSGLRWRDYNKTKPQATRTSSDVLSRKIGKSLGEILKDELKKDPDLEELKVSTQKLKETTGLTKIPKRTFTRALKKFKENTSKWVMEGRSLVYKSASYYGF